MPTRTAFIYERKQGEFDLKKLGSILEPWGFSPGHPIQGIPLVITAVGDQVSISEEDIDRKIKDGEDVSLQFWHSEDSLFVRVRMERGVRVLEFGLGGTLEEEQEVLKLAFLNFFYARATEGLSLGFVFDSEGVAEEYDWDQFFINGSTLEYSSFDAGLPAILLIAPSLLGRVIGFSRSLRRYDIVSLGD